jgi:hypothetical protein
VADNKYVNATNLVITTDASMVWNFGNTLLSPPNDDPNWTSSTNMTELSVAGVYCFATPYSRNYGGQTVTNGHLYVISRYVDDMTSVNFNGLTTIDRMAAVLVDSSGNYATGWTLGEAGMSTFGVNTLEVLHQVPGIFQNPLPRAGAAGQNVQFTVVPTGDDPSFQRMPNGVDIPGATRSEYLHTVQANDNGALLSVKVTNLYGAPRTSTGAALTVVSAAAPTINTQPAKVSLSSGHVATFTVTAAAGQGLRTSGKRTASPSTARPTVRTPRPSPK